MIALAIICILGGLMLLPQLRGFLGEAAGVLLSGSSYKDTVLGALR
jgi:hypothetical protein